MKVEIRNSVISLPEFRAGHSEDYRNNQYYEPDWTQYSWRRSWTICPIRKFWLYTMQFDLRGGASQQQSNSKHRFEYSRRMTGRECNEMALECNQPPIDSNVPVCTVV